VFPKRFTQTATDDSATSEIRLLKEKLTRAACRYAEQERLCDAGESRCGEAGAGLQGAVGVRSLSGRKARRSSAGVVCHTPPASSAVMGSSWIEPSCH